MPVLDRSTLSDGNTKKVIQIPFSRLLLDTIRDLTDGIKKFHLWRAFAVEDVLDTYRHTSIGVLWAVFSFSFFALAIIIVFGMNRASGPSPDYVAHMVSGLLAWNFLSAIITQGPNIFVANERFLKGVKLPFSVFAYHITLRTLILNGYAAISAAVFLLVYGYPSSWAALAAFPAVILFVFAAIPVQLLLGSLGAYTRDVQQIIENMMRAIFFLTPVIWIPEPGTHRFVIAELNPLTAFIEIFRMPLVEGEIPWEFWQRALLLTAAIWVAALFVFSYTRRRIVFWL